MYAHVLRVQHGHTSCRGAGEQLVEQLEVCMIKFVFSNCIAHSPRRRLCLRRHIPLVKHGLETVRACTIPAARAAPQSMSLWFSFHTHARTRIDTHAHTCTHPHAHALVGTHASTHSHRREIAHACITPTRRAARSQARSHPRMRMCKTHAARHTPTVVRSASIANAIFRA